MSEKHSTDLIQPEKSSLSIGFIPLTDCASLAVAKEKGYFEKYGLDVTLHKEASWANIRDKLAYGIHDCVHMLATMPITSTLGVGGWKKDTVSALVLGANGNAITISNHLFDALESIAPGFSQQRPVTAEVLKQYIEQRKSKGETPLTFAHVFPTSTHNYFLRYWLASAGIDPENDVNLIVIPPQQMVSNLEANVIDGFCVGEPWNQYAVSKEIGHALITSYEIWNNAAEKVLGVNKEWAYKYPNTHKAVLKAVIEAATWIDDPANRDETAEIIAQEDYINVPVEIIKPPLNGSYRYSPAEEYQPVPHFNLFSQNAASFPWYSHAAWYMTQMMRWGDIPQSLDMKNIIKDVFWVDLYRQVMDELGLDYPLPNSKKEGEHAIPWQVSSSKGELILLADMFLDKAVFKPF